MEIDFEVYFCLVKKILFIIIVVMCLKPILPVVEYVVNYEYISKVLCVNKAKPMMHCDGKCHLKKELANASDSENPISDKKIKRELKKYLINWQREKKNILFKISKVIDI